MKIAKETIVSPQGEIALYTLTNAHGSSVRLSSLGAGIVSVVVPDCEGHRDDVVLGYAHVSDYFHDGPCAGKVPGRYANRIGKGQFELDRVKYQLRINNGPHALHGGPEGFANKLWDSEVTETGVRFTLLSADGDENYPGNVGAGVDYTWNDEDQLTLVFMAKSDKKTIINLTNHTYWNLSGENSGTVLDHKLWLACSHYVPTDDTLLPTGHFETVKGTPMDFTAFKRLGRDLRQDFPALNYGKGYDNCWMVDGWQQNRLQKVAELVDEKSGRRLEVISTQPAVQVYTGNWLAGSPGNKGAGRSYNDYEGVAIECQGVPDAPNHPQFPSQVLTPDREYKQIIVFKLSVIR